MITILIMMIMNVRIMMTIMIITSKPKGITIMIITVFILIIIMIITIIIILTIMKITTIIKMMMKIGGSFRNSNCSFRQQLLLRTWGLFESNALPASHRSNGLLFERCRAARTLNCWLAQKSLDIGTARFVSASNRINRSSWGQREETLLNKLIHLPGKGIENKSVNTRLRN